MKRLLGVLLSLALAATVYATDVKISELTEVTSPTTSTAVLAVVDAGTTKKVTIDNLLKVGSVTQAYDADLTTWAGVTPGTGVATALAVNVGSAGAPVLFDGALGTPSSGTVTNLTGTASININGTVGATTPAAGAFTTLTASTSLAVTADASNGGYIRLLEGSGVGTDYSSITGAADASSYPSFTFSGSKGSEDLTLTAASDKWTIASTTGATVEITPATKITGALTLAGQLNLMTTDADPATTAGGMKHDSTDTGASGGGSLKWFDGTNVRTLMDTGTTFTHITKYEYLPIRYAEDDVSVAAPAAAAEIGTTSLIARSFAEDADNGVIFFWQIPSDYVSGIKYRVFYALNANGQADETAAFSLAGCSVGNSDALACSEGTAVVVTDELGTDDDTGELLITDWSAAVTITNAAAGEMASLLLIRDVSEDDYADHLLVSGIEIKYVSKIAPFSNY